MARFPSAWWRRSFLLYQGFYVLHCALSLFSVSSEAFSDEGGMPGPGVLFSHCYTTRFMFSASERAARLGDVGLPGPRVSTSFSLEVSPRGVLLLSGTGKSLD